MQGHAARNEVRSITYGGQNNTETASGPRPRPGAPTLILNDVQLLRGCADQLFRFLNHRNDAG